MAPIPFTEERRTDHLIVTNFGKQAGQRQGIASSV